MSDASEELEATRRECARKARQHRYTKKRFTPGPALVSLQPNEAGFYSSCPYHGEPFDSTRFRLVEGDWDHEHCYICFERIEPGDMWWAAAPPQEIGLCLACHSELFGPTHT